MKRSILLLACGTSVLVITTRAQSTTAGTSVPPNNKPLTQVPKSPPTQRAIHQLEALQERIDLSQEQVLNLNTIYLEENMALDSLTEHPSGDQKIDNQVRRDIYHDADVRVYACLNESQQVQYVLWKQDNRIKNLEKRQKDTQAILDSLNRQQPQQPQLH